MIAAFFDGPGRIVLRDIETPVPGPGEVAVAVAACGICGSDLHQLHGRWPQPPYVPGHEIVGVVSAVGPGVASVAVDDRVCVEPFLYCGMCRYCLAGRYYQCPDMGFLTLTAHGAFADTVVTPAYTVYRLPDAVSLDVGVLTEPLAVAVHGARLAALSAGEEVLILGAGAIGLMAVATARHSGAGPITVAARYPHQAAAARALGADEVCLPEDLPSERKPGTGGPDVVFETVGSSAGTFQQAIRLAGSLARVVLIGGNTGCMDGIDLAPVVNKELTLLGSGAYAQFGVRRDFEVALSILAVNHARFEPLITHRFVLSEIEAAFAMAQNKGATGAIKVLVDPRS